MNKAPARASTGYGRPMRLLLVEDDARLGDMLARGLVEEGFAVEQVVDGEAGLARLSAAAHDVCVLDGRLPGLDGLDVLSRARADGVRIPILMLTARDGVPDRVRGLEAGADDYLVKPFAFAELTARLRALVRRGGHGDEGVLRCADLVLDVARHRVERAGVDVALSAKQFALLEILMRRPGEVVSRRAVLDLVFGYGFDPGTNIVDVHVAHLRKKLDRPGEASLIDTVRGVGYRLSAPGG